MSRALRVEFPGACYHVMARGVARQDVFRDDADRQRFLAGVGEAVAGGGLEVLAFCLMANHIHLLVRTPRGGLARVMRHVNGDYATAFNRRHRRVGHLWQGRYKALLVGDAEYLAECSRYIHLNPDRAKLTRPAERWRWSSYRNYVGGPTVADWVETAPVLEAYGGSRARYRAYVEAGRGEAAVSPFERAVAGLVLGGEAFVARVRRLVARHRDAGEQPSLRALRRAPHATPEAVEAAVAAEFADAGPAHRRRLTLVALRRHSALGPSAIGRRRSCAHSAVAMAVRAIDAEAASDRGLAANLRRLARRLRS